MVSKPIQTLHTFVFGGIAATESLKTTDANLDQQLSLARNRSPLLEDFNSSTQVDAAKMSSIYELFYCFENSIRQLVAQRLSEKHGVDWWSRCASGPIQKQVAGRKARDEKNRWHAPRANSAIAYANFGDLTNLITNNFVDFEDLFPDQEWVRARIGDLEESRNVIGHNNVLSEVDIERLKIYISDWLRQVGG